MIGKDSTQVFGIVPKQLKRRMARVRKQNRQWSESKMIKEGLLRLLPELEEPLGFFKKPSQ